MARRKKTKKKIDKKRLRKQYGENFDVFEQAIDNGVIVKMQELVYPIFILPGAFAVGGQQKKGSAAFDVDLFMEQNKLVKRPNKAKIRKALKDTLRKMLITKNIIEDDYVLDPQTGEEVFVSSYSGVDKDGNDEYIEGVTVKSVSAMDRALKRAMKEAMDKYNNIDQKDAHLVRAYARAIIALAPYISSIGKAYKKHKKEFDRLSNIRPGTFKSSRRVPKKRRKTTVQKQKGKQRQLKQKQQRVKKLKASDLEKQAVKYSKLQDKRGEYSKLIKKFSKADAQDIVRRSKRIDRTKAAQQKKAQQKQKKSQSKRKK